MIAMRPSCARYLTTKSVIKSQALKVRLQDPGDAWRDQPQLGRFAQQRPSRWGHPADSLWYVTEPDPAAVDDLMRWGFGLFKTMALSRHNCQWPPAHAGTAADLERLANAADHIVVDAFDFDGFVVWTSSREA